MVISETNHQDGTALNQDWTRNVIKTKAQNSESKFGSNTAGASYFLYHCPCCTRVFSIKKLFQLHLENMHKDVESFHCELCQMKLESAKIFMEHTWREHALKRVVPPCPFCGLQCRIAYDLNFHIAENHTKTCPVCFITFESAQDVALGHHECNPRPLEQIPAPSATCPKCRIFFPDKSMLPKHIDICQPFVCHICHAKLNTEGTFTTHIYRHKSDMEGQLIQCDQCPVMVRGHHRLNLHMHSKHRFVTCEYCERQVPKQRINQHIRTHTKPFQCSVCHERFAEKKICENHELGHFGQNPNKCDLCGKCFKEKSKLKKHMITHTDTKNYKCQFCQKAFRLRGVCRSHERAVHATENSFHCTETDCGKSFKSNASLYQHLKVTHRKGLTFSCDFCGGLFATGQLLRAHQPRCGGRTVGDGVAIDSGTMASSFEM